MRDVDKDLSRAQLGEIFVSWERVWSLVFADNLVINNLVKNHF